MSPHPESAVGKQTRLAASSRLEPGQHSVDRNTPTQRVKDGSVRFVLDWSVRMYDGLLIQGRRTQGATKTEVRKRARKQAEELLATKGVSQAWQPSNTIEKYIDTVSLGEIERAELRPASVRRYRDLLELLRTRLAGRSILATMHYDVLVDAIDSIGHAHGPEAARQSKSVLGRYIIEPMRRHRLIDRDPLLGHRLRLQQYASRREGPKRGGQGLTLDEHHQVIEYLLALDPTHGVTAPKRGRYTFDDRVARNERIIGLTLFQSGTGLRISEALQITPDLVVRNSHGELYIHVTPEIAKTGIGRDTPVLMSAVHDWLEKLLTDIGDEPRYLFGTPTDPRNKWRADGSTGASPYVAELYRRMADELDIDLLLHLRSHLWRTTLGSRCREAGIPREVYAPLFGHDVTTNQQYYTQDVDLHEAMTMFREVHSR